MSAAPHLAVSDAVPAPGAAAAPDLLDDRALAFLAGLHQPPAPADDTRELATEIAAGAQRVVTSARR